MREQGSLHSLFPLASRRILLENNMTELKLGRTDVCKRLSIAVDTFDRWVKRGRLEVFRDGTLTNARKQVVWLTLESLGKALKIHDENKLRARLGLPDLETERLNAIMRGDVARDEAPEPEPETSPEPQTIRPLSNVEVKAAEDLRFAEAYLKGEATDSCGNRVDGSNDRFLTKGSASLLGPQEDKPKVRPSCTSHMTSPLGSSGNAMDAPRPLEDPAWLELVNPGHAKRMAEVYRSARIRQPSPQERKIYVDRKVIAAAFRYGFSR